MRVAIGVLLLLGSTSASYATMPALSDAPKPPTLQACQAWAAKQDDDAIAMWGTQESGGTSRDLAISRLTGDCMGDQPPEIVGFGSSAGFDEQYCAKHVDSGICKGRKEDQERKGDVLINQNGLVADVSFCKGDQVLTPGKMVGDGCMHFDPLRVSVVSTSGSKLIVLFNVDNGPNLTMLADQDSTKLVCGGEDVPVKTYLAGGSNACTTTGKPQASIAQPESTGDTAARAIVDMLKIEPRDFKADDCVVKGSMDSSRLIEDLSIFRDAYLNRDYSFDFYAQRRRQVFAYIILKRAAELITDSLYNGKSDKECSFSLSISYSDKFGQEHHFEALTWRFNNEQSHKVNWDKFDPRDFGSIALDYRLTDHVSSWVSDEPSMGEEKKPVKTDECDMFLFNANAIFVRSTTFCRKDYVDSKEGLAALAGARQCMGGPEAEMKQKIGAAMLTLDKIERARGRSAVCQFVEEVARQVRARL